MNTLVTSSFHSHVIASADRGWEIPGFPEDVRIQSEGTILAGVDLEQITIEDVDVSGSQVVIHLPPAHIVSQEVEVVEIWAQEGLLPGVDSNLQTEAEALAREELLAAACENGILQDAKREAEIALTGLLNSLQFEDISIITTDSLIGGSRGCP